ncbi:unnamed protein product [Arabidopsis lyrata]|nr:unnamed protein product [Arabidopsis lyrata]
MFCVSDLSSQEELMSIEGLWTAFASGSHFYASDLPLVLHEGFGSLSPEVYVSPSLSMVFVHFSFRLVVSQWIDL